MTKLKIVFSILLLFIFERSALFNSNLTMKPFYILFQIFIFLPFFLFSQVNFKKALVIRVC